MRNCYLENKDNTCCCGCLYVESCSVSCLDRATYTCEECSYKGLEFGDNE